MVSEGVEKVCMCVVRYGLQRRVWGRCYRYTQVHVGCLFGSVLGRPMRADHAGVGAVRRSIDRLFGQRPEPFRPGGWRGTGKAKFSRQ